MQDKTCIVMYLMVIIPFLFVNNLYADCIQDSTIGRVSYVRNYFGGDHQKMPGLCSISSDCGAYNAWNYWDLGFGKGYFPQVNSIMIIDRDSQLPYGHMAVVVNVNEDVLTVHESNWYSNERCDCNVKYTFDQDEMSVTRRNDISNKYSVLGFVYSKNNYETTSKLSNNQKLEPFKSRRKISKFPGENCGEEKVYDCQLNCIYLSDANNWTGDGFCDDGEHGIFLNCSVFNSDGGDCILFNTKAPREKCSDENIYDCDLNCVNAVDAINWIGDGKCDNGEFGININCKAFHNDNGDCNIDKQP